MLDEISGRQGDADRTIQLGFFFFLLVMEEADDSVAVIGIGCNFPGGKPIVFEFIKFLKCLFQNMILYEIS